MSHKIEFTLQRQLSILLFFLGVTLTPAWGQQQESKDLSEFSGESSGYPDLDMYYSQLRKNTHEATSTRRSLLMRSTPLDTFIMRYMHRGFDVACDTASLFDFFHMDRTILPWEEEIALIDRIHTVAQQYGSRRLQLAADYFKGRSGGIESGQYAPKMEWLEEVVRKCRKAGDTYLEAFALENMWQVSYYGGFYARSFVYAQQLAEVLDKVDDNYPFKAYGYCWLGTAHFHFRNYERALPYLHKTLSYRSKNCTSDVGQFHRAWNLLASYHYQKGNLDSAVYYHRTSLSSPEGVSGYPVHLHFAISNLGWIEMDRGNYDAAIALMEAGLGHMEGNRLDKEFMAGVHTALAQCYLAKGELSQVRLHMENAREAISRLALTEQLNRKQDFFRLQSNYYARLGRHGLSAQSLDSALWATVTYQQHTGRHLILLGEQQLQAAEMQLKNTQIGRQKNMIVSGLVMLAVFSAALLIIIRLYRKKDKAYTALAARAMEWAHDTSSAETAPPDNRDSTKEEATQKDREIMAVVEHEMNTARIYREPGMTAEGLSERLGIHRNTLSRAINQVTGSNFNQYINSYRIKEAVRLISENDRSQLYIDELYERVGFGNRTSFYRTFKQFTGLSPIEFQKKKNQPNTEPDF